jgi:hypothetical protein
MKDLGNKMRDLGRYYEVFGETAAVAAMDMKTETASDGNLAAPLKSGAFAADRRKYEGFGETRPLPCSLAGWRRNRETRRGVASGSLEVCQI